MQVTMLNGFNGMPITMLNGGMGCNCQQNDFRLGELPKSDPLGALLVAGVCLLPALIEKKPKALNGIGTDILKDSVGKVAMVGAGVAALYFIAIKPTLEAVGLKDSKEDKLLDTQEKTFISSTASPFNPAAYKKTGATIDTATAERLAKQIYDADGYFNDDEDSVYAALKAMIFKANVSRVSEVFANKYQKDMYSYMRAFLDDSEMTNVHNIVNALR